MVGGKIKQYSLEVSASNGLRAFRECSITKKEYSVDISHHAWKGWQDGIMIQDAFPSLDKEQREFLITGLTPAEWSHMCGYEDEDE